MIKNSIPELELYNFTIGPDEPPYEITRKASQLNVISIEGGDFEISIDGGSWSKFLPVKYTLPRNEHNEQIYWSRVEFKNISGAELRIKCMVSSGDIEDNSIKFNEALEVKTDPSKPLDVTWPDPLPVDATFAAPAVLTPRPLKTIPAGQSVVVVPADPNRKTVAVTVFEIDETFGSYIWTGGADETGLPMLLGQTFAADTTAAVEMFNSGPTDARVAIVETGFA